MLDERYNHRFHAGNSGDVWKHMALSAYLATLTQDERPFTVIVILMLVPGAMSLGLLVNGPRGHWQVVGKPTPRYLYSDTTLSCP